MSQLNNPPPLDYARPSGQSPGNNFGQQAAKAAWVAPIIALAIGCLSRGAWDRTAMLLIGVVNVILLLVGLIAGCIALFGMGRWGRERVLAPAIVGVVINTLLLALVGSTLVVARRLATAPRPGNTAAATAARRATEAQLEQQGKDAALKSGWFGISTDGMQVIILTLPDETPFVRDVLNTLPMPVSIASLLLDNTAGKSDVEVNIQNVVLTFSGGRTEPAPDGQKIAQGSTDRSIRDAFATTFRVPAGEKVVNKFVFLPQKLDQQNLDSISIRLDGRELRVPGRYFTAEEKAAFYKKGTEAGAKSP